VAVTMQAVRAVLDPEEPDYGRAAQLGPEALPHLQTLIEGHDTMLAAKAAYAAGVIGAPDSADVVATAARSPHVALRLAAATAAGHLPSADAERIFSSLLDDDDRGVRKVALTSLEHRPTAGILTRVERLTESDPDPGIRRVAEQTLQKLMAER
jgi:HEAT repeat protein